MTFVSGAEDAAEVDENEIVEQIFEAVVEQRLPPGTKLSEAALCEAYGVGRMRIRRALLLLASREVVELHANRGAYVARPTPQQAHDVFEARMALEPSITRLAIERADEQQLAQLIDHVEREHAAHHAGQRREAIRLSGQFHGLLAQVAGNAIMMRMMKDLTTRTSLIIGMFGRQDLTDCRDDDHARILTAIRTRDAEEGARLMREHLRQIKDTLDLTKDNPTALDLVSILKR